MKSLVFCRIRGDSPPTISRAPIGITSLPCYTGGCRFPGTKFTTFDIVNSLPLYSNHTNENLTDVSNLVERWNKCQYVDISNNKISALPDGCSKLSRLENLNLANNMFASFPDVLVHMTWLHVLNLSGNQFTELPAAFDNLINLRTLILADDSGYSPIKRIPVALKNFGLEDPMFDLTSSPSQDRRVIVNSNEAEKIDYFKYCNKGFTDIVPLIPEWKNCYSIDISSNKISSLPESISVLTLLGRLGLTGNQISELPDQISTLTRLTELRLGDNMLTKLPDSIGEISSLCILDVGHNKISAIPSSIGNLSFLLGLIIEGNMVTELPLSMTQLQRLERVVIFDYEGMTSVRLIPDDLNVALSWKQMYTGLKRSRSEWTPYAANEDDITFFKFHDKKLADMAQIIPRFAHCHKVKVSNTKISAIPPSISTLVHMRILDASRNKLSSLPNELLSMSTLRQLNLRSNQFVSLPDTCF
eukprot:TRINITY_DN3342_c0_g1_i1.p1 TRINITY_DN3342_c0_g1~~TRINITY_DN3342_c0_g1_i1.p1  ORF type:complete len:473 (-),score=65.03 TRINITY_DN3342_c0_g1_i1:333-1751(-)